MNKCDSRILLGNINADNLVTVVTNPHCTPCAKMHKKLDKLLELIGDRVCIQYVFTSFSSNLESSSLFLISVYFNNEDQSVVRKIYANWFDYGKDNREGYFDKYDCLIDDNQISQEYSSHKEWCKISNLVITPTLLVNGYKLPDYYRVEDLLYILV